MGLSPSSSATEPPAPTQGRWNESMDTSSRSDCSNTDQSEASWSPRRDLHNSLRPESQPPWATERALPHSKKLKGGTTIASQNMRGGRSLPSKTKWNQMNQVMHDRGIGVLALQETHIESVSRCFNRQLHIVSSHDPIDSASKGVAFLLSKCHVAWKDTTTTEIIPGHTLLLSMPGQAATYSRPIRSIFVIGEDGPIRSLN